MDKTAIAAKLLVLFVSGGTVEGTLAALPTFKTQIQATVDWMEAVGRCTASEIVERANRLRGIVYEKERAIRRQDFNLAAKLRAEECAFFERFRLGMPRGRTTATSISIGIDQQIKELAALFEHADVKPGAVPSV
jgi:hypothetical protein